MQNGLRNLFLIFALLFVSLAKAELGYYEDTLPNLVASPAAFRTRDVFFLPEEGGFLSSTELSFDFKKSAFSDANSTTSKELSASVFETLNYALRDNLLLGGGFGFLIGRTEDMKASGKETFSLSGMKDPLLSLLYRAVDQKEAPYFLDLQILFNPSVGQSLYSNALRGGHKLEGVLSCGQVLWNFEYKFSFFGIYYALAKVQDGDVIVNQNPSYAFGASTLIQYDFDRDFSMNIGFGLSVPRKVQNQNDLDYEKPLYAFAFDVGPSYQFSDFFSSSLKFKASYEQGDMRRSPNIYKYTTTSYGLMANLDYAF